MQAKPLAGDGVSVLQPTVIDESFSDPQSLRQFGGDIVAVAIRFLHPNQAVFAFAGGLKAKNLIDLKIFQPRLEPRRAE